MTVAEQYAAFRESIEPQISVIREAQDALMSHSARDQREHTPQHQDEKQRKKRIYDKTKR